MEFEKIRQLIEDVGNSKLSAIEINFPDGTKVNMKKQEYTTKIKENVEIIPDQLSETRSKEENYQLLTSPMVGTFYKKPNPDANPFVEVGQKVKKGEVVCLIEAMKLMNEIESEWDGEIKEILVQDGDRIDFGKPLFKIEQRKESKC